MVEGGLKRSENGDGGFSVRERLLLSAQMKNQSEVKEKKSLKGRKLRERSKINVRTFSYVLSARSKAQVAGRNVPNDIVVFLFFFISTFARLNLTYNDSLLDLIISFTLLQMMHVLP
ncbi:unnamed protein product [Vicia faba]|uniref:Uncharacterized protein n=1 Tax=Vicia faba TaxID=3906 RepID=A0AAV1BAE4_VICFA|nr:unnamed protein product [Vicia faba]